jgi:uncharacterized protein (DUF58 family)
VNGVLGLPAGSGTDPGRLLRGLELQVTRKLDGLLQGDYQGLVPGHGSEAGESRTYEPGDDVRRIDWPLTARSGRVHVRQTIADRELETWALVDASSSMEFGTALGRKRDFAVAAVGAIGFLTARGGNRLGMALLEGDRLRIVPARGGRRALLALLREALTREGAPEGREIDLASGIRKLANLGRRGSLAVVVSDFLCPSPWPSALRALSLSRQVLAVEVIDPRELELPAVGYLTLVDPETGRVRDVQSSDRALRARYAEAAGEQRASNASAIRRAGASHLVLRTDRDWVRDVVAFVVASRRTRTVTAAAR